MNFPFIKSRNNSVGFCPASEHCCKILLPPFPTYLRCTGAIADRLLTATLNQTQTRENTQKSKNKFQLSKNVHILRECVVPSPALSQFQDAKTAKTVPRSPQAITNLPITEKPKHIPNIFQVQHSGQCSPDRTVLQRFNLYFVEVVDK